MSKTVAVFGSTGAIGTNLVQIISENEPEWKILAISRSGGSKSRLASLKLSNVEMVKCEIEKLNDAEKTCEGVDMIYCCVGFSQYERSFWAEHWPIVVDNLLALTSSERPLVFCDNLYAYGNPPDAAISPTTSTLEPNLKSKPNIRSFIRQKLQERMTEEPSSCVVVGGADFFGPYVTDKSFLGDTFMGYLVKGKKPLALGCANVIHDFCFAKDFANALYVVSTRQEAMGRFWICPHSIHNKSLNDIMMDANQYLTKKKVEGKASVVPNFMIQAMGLLGGFMGEMKEMMHIWVKDYKIDDSDFIQTFGIEATPHDEAIKETVEFFEKREAGEIIY